MAKKVFGIQLKINDKKMRNNTSSLNELQKALGEALGIRIIDMVHNRDFNSWKKLGLSQDSYNAIVREIPTVVNIAVAKSVRFKIDENTLLHAIRSINTSNYSAVVLHKWVQHNASFELCRHFWKNHTQREHTKLRNQLRGDSIIVNKEFNQSPGESDEVMFYDYLGKLASDNKDINFELFDQYYDSHKIELNKLWHWFKNTLRK